MRRVRDTLREHLRGNDIVGRWAPLQFSVLLPETDGAAAELRMARIREVLNRPFSPDADGEAIVRLDPRIGLADRKGGEAFNVLVEQAEQALEIAMESDKRVFLYKVRPFG
ncbi:GGDEF domain-containing protein [Candidatus Parcubacteria bacterium]|nr:MAG: GGDEF domain-containing protein [Candidatus Parcubacteria bacterium]